MLEAEKIRATQNRLVLLGLTGVTRLVLPIGISPISGPHFERSLVQITKVPLQICSARSLEKIENVRGAKTLGNTEQTGVTRSDWCYSVGVTHPCFKQLQAHL